MSEEELYQFYAGCALIGILSNRGTVDMATALSAHDMSVCMVDIQKRFAEEKEKANDK